MRNDLYKRKVSDAMSREVVTVRADASMHEALELMVENRVSALPVVSKQGKCIGIVSTTDLVDITLEIDDELAKVSDTDFSLQSWLLKNLEDRMGGESVVSLMSDNVEAVHADTPLVEAAEQMTRNHVHRLPVVRSSDEVIGIISTTDILKAFVEAKPK